jgi:hypothetical protein
MVPSIIKSWVLPCQTRTSQFNWQIHVTVERTKFYWSLAGGPVLIVRTDDISMQNRSHTAIYFYIFFYYENIFLSVSNLFLPSIIKSRVLPCQTRTSQFNWQIHVTVECPCCKVWSMSDYQQIIVYLTITGRGIILSSFVLISQ